MDAGEDCLVAFGFARPAAFGGVLDELLLACQASPEAGGVLAGGEELGVPSRELLPAANDVVLPGQRSVWIRGNAHRRQIT